MKIMIELANIGDSVNTKVNSLEYKSFKEAIKATHVKIINDIKDHVQRNTEASGAIIQNK